MASEIAEEYQNKGLSAGDLVQEANMALLLLASEYEGGNFRAQAEERIREALEEALEFQDTECRIEEEMLARVNVLTVSYTHLDVYKRQFNGRATVSKTVNGGSNPSSPAS